jgi:chromatin segregation and condensation protein Rec8/ScpA/Scc1 (kleisin family)
LELVREGEVELRQKGHFAPLYVRRRLRNQVPLAEAANG